MKFKKTTIETHLTKDQTVEFIILPEIESKKYSLFMRHTSTANLNLICCLLPTKAIAKKMARWYIDQKITRDQFLKENGLL